MTRPPRQIFAWETTDGKVHTVLDLAEEWQTKLDGAATANQMLQDGWSLLDSLVGGGLLSQVSADRMPELGEVTKDTKLIIEHWQCRDDPGYQPQRITPEGYVYVHGDAGSWSGSYGTNLPPGEIARYWADTKKRTKP